MSDAHALSLNLSVLFNRQHLIKLCQDEEVLRNKYFSDLELIAQKIRSIPLTTEVSVQFLLKKKDEERTALQSNDKLGQLCIMNYSHISC